MSYRFHRVGKGRTRGAKGLNATELEYAQLLSIRKASGQIREYWTHGVTLQLAPECRYTPEFLVMTLSDELECIEVKGGKEKKIDGKPTGEATYWAEEDAKIKIKVAAQMYPFRFRIVFKAPKKLGGQWQEVEV